MATAEPGPKAAGPRGALSGGASTNRRLRRAVGVAVVVVLVLVAWEAVKWVGGDPWRIHGSVLGIPVDYEHHPPLEIRLASDLALPHVWDIGAAIAAPAQRNGPPLGQVLFESAVFTFREALVGFAIGALLGLVLAVVFVHVRFLERALVPYVVASQTVPIIAIAPIIVIFLQAGWLSVAVIAAYLTFFPVTVAALRGMRAADPRAFELMRSYAASRRQILWRLRLPAATPYLFTALRVAATASIIGAIIGELPSGIPDGLGGAILNFKQDYVSNPSKLWATILASCLLGLWFVGLVRLTESFLTRGRYREPGVAL